MTQAKIFCDKISTCAQQMFAMMDIELTDNPADADLIWMRKKYRAMYDMLKESQLINHIPHEPEIINKEYLTHTLKKFAKKTQSESILKRFYCETYRLNDLEEYQQFMATLPPKDHQDNLWIMKPSSLSRGMGMKVLWQFDEFRKQGFPLKPAEFIADIKDNQHYIIQRYIKDVLLLNGKKSETRIYWLVASLDPFIVLFYPEGTVRVTMEDFKLDDFDNPLIHITNTYQQKKSAAYHKDVSLKWSYTELTRYLHEKNLLDKSISIDQYLDPKIRECLSFVANACQKEFKKTPETGDFFALFGADFILDNSLQPWLAEIQKGPGLSFSDPIKKKLLPAIFSEAIEIVLEIQARKRAGQPLNNLKSIKKFQPLIGVENNQPEELDEFLKGRNNRRDAEFKQ